MRCRYQVRFRLDLSSGLGACCLTSRRGCAARTYAISHETKQITVV